MRNLVIKVLILLQLLVIVNGESSKCLTVYKQGGAPAVFQSPKCPRWQLSDYGDQSRTSTCQTALLQGRRKHMEDRVFCNLDVLIPFPGKTGLTELNVGIMAVFDGHNGAEASEMASKLFLEYFMLHIYFLLDATYYGSLKNSLEWLPNKGQKYMDGIPRLESLERNPAVIDGSFRLEILKKSLLNAIRDIDATFSKEASKYNLRSGSTAAVILIAEGQFLVANVGDSKALLCSEKFQSPEEAKANLLRLHRERRRSGAIVPFKNRYNLQPATSNGLAHFFVKELTNDHHLDRHDERSRVENAGGSVLEWGGVPRVNGELAVSRAIGDVSFKSFGVISTPELTDWQPLMANDSYLVAASDGIFEKLSSQDVCDILWEVHAQKPTKSEFSSTCSHSSLADCLVNTAFDKGSTDNMAAVLVPLRSIGFSGNIMAKSRGYQEGHFDSSTSVIQESIHKHSGNGINSGTVRLDYAHPVMAKFDRLLVEGKNGNFGLFYLSEELSEDAEYTFWVRKNEHEDDLFDLPMALPNTLGHHYGGPLNLYNDQNFCSQLTIETEEDRDQCINPDGLARFIGFLESLPFHSTDSSYGPFESATPDYRYTLKKRFGRGSYGEVWVAFNWNFSLAQNQNLSEGDGIYDSSDANSRASTSSHENLGGSSDGNLFILKRIMVERGPAVYLSGLREKYFGEVFLNGTKSLRGNNFNEMENPFPGKMSGFADAVHEEGLNHIARYVESLESKSNEIWLVFRHEGMSLSKLMYTVEDVEHNDDILGEQQNNVQVLHPSKWWHWLKTTDAGQEEMRSIIWQLLMAVKSCHDRNITHRDIKPENMVICFEEKDTGRCLKGIPDGDKNFTTKMRIIDFGSAIDEFTMKHLYGSTGPSRAEQTSEYSPPEAFLNASWYKGPTSGTLKYDMWSVGVVMLEMIIGTPNVFQINDLTRALLEQHIGGWNDDLKDLAYKLRSFMELCILVPGSSLKHHGTGGTKHRGGVSPASWRCSEEFFSNEIKSRDPLKLGFPDVWAMRLVRQLLLWDPEDRLTADESFGLAFPTLRVRASQSHPLWLSECYSAVGSLDGPSEHKTISSSACNKGS